ncbi:protein SICKLE-like [Nicotiana tabacum]|uniref:Endo-1,4-beta-xylanase C n=1 Tax=Nicotiana sylvestris TaxID=4096 RepID=A0A1U7XJ13_NICSY|nr:PREDICTED: endo-1,4-beta-xylanase C [Nicotiana sylvestris]
MEEESAKRKERLKAMRMEASQSGDYNETQNHLQGLSNPLIESPSGQAEFHAAPRFDYYTDPMAAFSANKKWNDVSPQVSQPCYTPPRPRNPQSPIYTARGNYSVDQRSQSQGVHHTFNPLGNPGQNSPFGTPQRSSPNAWDSSFGTSNNYFPPNSSIGGNFASPGIHQGGRPGFHYGQGRGNPGSGYRGSPSQGSGYRGSPYQGPGHRGSPYQGSAQGRSQWMGNSSSPVSVQRGRRGLGSHGCTSAESRPNLYYNKSMVEDPWKELKPVIWKPLNAPSNKLDTPESEKSSWLPKSISAKKAKIPDAPPLKSTPQQSLAEYLSASFNEAASNEAGKDGSGI